MREELRDLISEAIERVYPDSIIPADFDIRIERPDSLEYGDYAAPVGFSLAPILKHAPGEIAKEIALAIVSLRSKKSLGIKNGFRLLEDKDFACISYVGGYINFKLSADFLKEAFRNIIGNIKSFRQFEREQSKKILLEFVSSNPTGPLNIVSARAAAVGSTLAKLLINYGHEVTTEFYINNRGRQAHLLAKSVLERYKELVHGKQPEIPDDGYQGDYVIDIAKAFPDDLKAALEAMASEEQQIESIKEFAIDYIIANQREELERFNTSFDNWIKETKVVEKGLVDLVINKLRDRGLLYDNEGATWLATSKVDAAEDDDVLIKSDGSYTYFLVDIAYHLHKARRGHDLLINILGPDHHGHIGRMKAALRALEIECDLEFLVLQQVNLLEEGQRVKMSKREGRFVRLSELINEIGIDVSRFFFLNRKLESHLDFDLELARTESDENPVFYIQYAHARISSIKRFASNKSIELLPPTSELLDRFSEDVELGLVREIYSYKDILRETAEERQAHKLATYLQSLASAFHVFYHNNRIIDEAAKATSEARLSLIEGLRIVLEDGLSMMGISAPDKM